MAVLDPRMKAQIEADPRVQQMAHAAPGGTVSTEQLQSLGYNVPPHTKYVLRSDAKGYRATGGPTGMAYNDEMGTTAKLIAAGAGGLLGGAGLGAMGIGPFAGSAAPVGSMAPGAAAADTIPFSTSPGVSAAALSGQVGPAAGLGASGASGAAAGAGGGLSGLLKSLTSGQNLPSLIGLGASLAGGALNGGGGGNTDELDRMRAITEARMRRTDPLHQAITALAMSRLPTNMQRPVPDIPLPE